jgi:hypothetical protein
VEQMETSSWEIFMSCIPLNRINIRPQQNVGESEKCSLAMDPRRKGNVFGEPI